MFHAKLSNEIHLGTKHESINYFSHHPSCIPSGPDYVAGAELASNHLVKSSDCPQASELKTCKTAPQVKQEQFCRISVPHLGSVPIFA
jgi:hypothetical protein